MPRTTPEGHVPVRFPTTQRSRVVTAVCHRHRGDTPEQARDMTQDSFADVLEHDLIAWADPARGRFRVFLRNVCVRHLTAQRDRKNSAKRGGERPPLSFDPCDAERRYAREPATR